MKLKWTVLVLLAATGLARGGENVFAKDAIVALMRKVNTYQRTHPWRRDDRNWIRATYYTGVMALYRTTKDAKVLDQALAWAKKHDWQVGSEKHPANRLTCVQTYLELYALKKDPAMIAKSRAYLDTRLKLTEPAYKRGWGYCDTLYVGPPAMAMMARATGQRKYLDTMHRVYREVTDHLLDTDEGLFYRDHRARTKDKSRNGKKVLWSRGNGWVIGGLPRILENLPKDDPQRGRYVKLLRTMATSLARRQGADGLWRMNLADPNDFPPGESSGTGFFCYALAWGVGNGVLDKPTFLPVVAKAWRGLAGAVDKSGKVCWGQHVGRAPYTVKKDHSHEYVTGAFLLAGSEVVKLVEAGLLPPKPKAEPAGTLAKTQHPLYRQINAFVSNQQGVKGFKPTGLTRADYLAVIAGQVKAMRAYQDKAGRIIDPVDKVEKYYATPCYAHSVAVLAGRGVTLRLAGAGVRFEVVEPASAVLKRSGRQLKHRNGIVEPISAEFKGTRAVYRISAI